MSDLLPPECHAPTCARPSEMRFLWLTPLCRAHAAKANHRAMLNVLTVGSALALAGLGLVAASSASPLRALGVAVGCCGALLALLALPFRLRARALAPQDQQPDQD